MIEKDHVASILADHEKFGPEVNSMQLKPAMREPFFIKMQTDSNSIDNMFIYGFLNDEQGVIMHQ